MTERVCRFGSDQIDIIGRLAMMTAGVGFDDARIDRAFGLKTKGVILGLRALPYPHGTPSGVLGR